MELTMFSFVGLSTYLENNKEATGIYSAELCSQVWGRNIGLHVKETVM